jgi:hypothetical protein
VHVLPLHALRSVWQERALLGKTHLAGRATSALRATTSRTDLALGLADYVHFYLLRNGSRWDGLPILATQLLAGREPPFPHVALEMSTERLKDDDCALCLWNIAVSRPAVPGKCRGGNWTRGTDSSRVLSIWRAFRATQPPTDRARGYWNDPILVPTLRGSQIADQSRLFSRASSGVPELLLQSPVTVDEQITVWAFSEDDTKAAALLETEFASIRVHHHPIDSYEARAPLTRAWRSRIEEYFLGRAPFPSAFDFDRKR